MQDICTRATIPCVSVSKKQGEAIIAAAKTEGTQATLVVDNILQPGEGTSYNVVGKIKGKSDAQQIILSSHYDVYFYGFQDNCAAVSLVLSVAKGLLDSGY
jgi:Zn-dependent M28 family amino/carboxypeptidase